MFPVQPVADLESYMISMEKKQQNMDKMISKLAGEAKDDNCKKPFGYIMDTVEYTIHVYIITLINIYGILYIYIQSITVVYRSNTTYSYIDGQRDMSLSKVAWSAGILG